MTYNMNNEQIANTLVSTFETMKFDVAGDLMRGAKSMVLGIMRPTLPNAISGPAKDVVYEAAKKHVDEFTDDLASLLIDTDALCVTHDGQVVVVRDALNTFFDVLETLLPCNGGEELN